MGGSYRVKVPNRSWLYQPLAQGKGAHREAESVWRKPAAKSRPEVHESDWRLLYSGESAQQDKALYSQGITAV